MLPRLASAISEPIPPPQATPCLVEIDTALFREDRFNPAELWYNTQCCGRWRDPSSNQLIIGRATQIAPDFTEQEVSREQFATWVANDANQINPKQREQLNDWVTAFSGHDVTTPQSIALNSFALEDVLFYPTDDPRLLIYAFHPRRVGNAVDLGWFCVILNTISTADPATLRATFEENFIGKIGLPSGTSKNQIIETSKLSMLRRGEKPPDNPNHPVRVEARKSVENYDDWWFAETDGYIILSDVATDIGTAVIRELQDRIPTLLQAYARLLPPLTLEPQVALIRLFQKREDYTRYVGAEYAWSGAVWRPARRELVCFLQDGQNMMRTFRHEAFHQYLSQAYCMMSAAPWLNEGHACLFESSVVSTKGQVVLIEDQEKVDLLLANIDIAVERLPFLLSASYSAFYNGEVTDRRLTYAMAYGFVYYLHKGAPLERNKPFATILPEFASALSRGCTYQEATECALVKIDKKALQECFRTFWCKNRNAASCYNPLAQ